MSSESCEGMHRQPESSARNYQHIASPSLPHHFSYSSILFRKCSEPVGIFANASTVLTFSDCFVASQVLVPGIYQVDAILYGNIRTVLTVHITPYRALYCGYKVEVLE